MYADLAILLLQFFVVHTLVLVTHALRHRISQISFFVLIGGLTVIT